jgi:hypothetical protein
MTTATDQPLYDLVIASRKYGYGHTTNTDAPIVWWKVAGQPKEALKKRVSLATPLIQERLQKYYLVDTEVHPTEVIRKYCKKTYDVTPGDGGLCDQDLNNIVVDKNRWPWPANVQQEVAL